VPENKIITDSSDYQLSKNRINSPSSPRPSNSSHDSPWKLGLMRTEWVRKVSRTVIHRYSIKVNLSSKISPKKHSTRNDSIMRAIMACRKKKMPWMRVSTLKINSQRTEYWKISPLSKLYEACVKWCRVQVDFSGRGYVSEIGNIVFLILNTMCFTLFLKNYKNEK